MYASHQANTRITAIYLLLRKYKQRACTSSLSVISIAGRKISSNLISS